MSDGPRQRKYSASQIETFLLCRRKWAIAKIAGIRGQDKPSAALGTATHGELERYLDGGDFDFARKDGAGYVAAAGVHLLPPPKAPGVRIEVPFDFSSVRTRFAYTGRKDLEIEDTVVFPGLEGGVPGVSDHKTTSNLSWAKTPEALENDVQAMLYAYELAQQRPDASELDLVWTYYQTRGGRSAKRVHLRVLPSHAERMFDAIETITTDMAEYEARAEALEGERLDVVNQVVPPNPGACSAFGGCDHSAICQLTTKERMRALMSKSSILDTLKARAAQAAASGAKVEPEINPPESKLEPKPAVEPEPLKAADLEPVPENAALDAQVKEIVEKAPRTRATKAVKPATEKSAGYTLYVDCFPIRTAGDVIRQTTTSAMLAEDARAIVQENTKTADSPGLADYRFAQYGEGPGMLTLAVRSIIQAKEFACDAVVVDTKTAEGLVLLPVLEAHAAGIVKAFR